MRILPGKRHTARGVGTAVPGQLMQHPAIVEIAAHGKTPGQIILRWHIQKGHIAIPKSSNESRIHENGDVFPSYSHRAIWIGLMRWTAANISEMIRIHSRGSKCRSPIIHNES